MRASALTVSQVVRLAKQLLESRFFNIWVEGEISDFADRGMLFFNLKDERASIRAVMYRSARRFLKFTPRDGMKVICRGKLSIYEPRGNFQIIVEQIIPKGIGELQAAFEELKRRLEAEGLFDEARKKPLPGWIERMAVVTSPAGAAIRDVVKNSVLRAPWVKISVYPVRVQGEVAAGQIARAIDDLNRMGGFDIIVITRGGGSIQDLWAFNEEVVARAIARSKIPVVSAVGHERDYTIADFAADKRVSTPTAVARLLPSAQEIRQNIVRTVAHLRSEALSRLERDWNRLRAAQPHLRSVPKRVDTKREQVIRLFERLKTELRRAANERSRRLNRLIKGLRYHHPKRMLARKRQEILRLTKEMFKGARGLIDDRRRTLATLHSRLHDLSPLNILARGYAVVLKNGQMRVVKSYEDVERGEQVDVALAKGGLVCEVVDRAPDVPRQIAHVRDGKDER